MSEWNATRTSETTWTATLPTSDWNWEIAIEATHDGLEVEGQRIPWADLLHAKAVVERTP